MLSGVLKPDDKPVSICIHLIVSSFICLFCFWAPFSGGCDHSDREALSILPVHFWSRLRNTKAKATATEEGKCAIRGCDETATTRPMGCRRDEQRCHRHQMLRCIGAVIMMYKRILSLSLEISSDMAHGARAMAASHYDWRAIYVQS